MMQCAALPAPVICAAAYQPQVGGKTFLINHFEAPQPSTAYVSELAADSNGKLRIVNTGPVDDTAAK